MNISVPNKEPPILVSLIKTFIKSNSFNQSKPN